MPRINRCIELFEQDQPIYYIAPGERGYEGGRQIAQTWADYIVYDIEHHPFDMNELRAFMSGLIAGGPTRSGHRMPAVIVTLPFDGTSPDVVRANSWVMKQVLACGVHGLLLVHAESPEAVKAFVEHSRYPFNQIGVGEGLDEGRRGGGGQADAAAVSAIPLRTYLDRADPWPLNPRGELLLGLKIENKRALSNCELSLKVPGLSFAEWGPGDMGMSLGFPDNHDEPYPPAMEAARSRVLAACKANGIKFLSSVYEHNVAIRIDEGVRICAGRDGERAAKVGRAYTKRTMPV
ncbi:MAG: aldolase/citrate lyase family protein [Thermomicrobiales bacterium]